MGNRSNWRTVASIVGVLFASVLTASAQTITSGDVAGTVTDPSGSVLVDAKLVLTKADTGVTQGAKTSQQGSFRFAFLPPGAYSLTVEAAGFQPVKRSFEIQVGQTARVDVELAVGSSTTIVEVSESVATVQTENGDIATTYSATQIAELPNPGNDTTAIAYTSPGTLINTGGGYGNFSTFGLPGTANLFTTNGQNNMDPYFNLNNSGATNLSLGKNEVAEASVINNAYSGQYGQLAGSQVNVVTQSGSNQFHGNAAWLWAGSRFAANDFFANSAGNPLTRYNDNQWADSIGGPIWKNKTFFFFNNEGIRVLLPAASTLVKIPSPQFEQATIANLNATGQSQAVTFYQKAFDLFNSAPGAKNASAIPGGGCSAGNVTFTLLGSGVPCALQFRQSGTNFTHERIWSLRVDQKIGSKDQLFGRYYDDNGLQATGTDPINTAFNAYSPQPAYQGQLSETHTFSPTAVNQFLFSGFYYSAIFGQTDYSAAKAVFPVQLNVAGFTNLAPIGAYPQGRIVKQWQYVDDFSKVAGKHEIKTGFNFHINPFADIGAQSNNVGTITSSNLYDFYSGGLGVTGHPAKNNLTQAFPTTPENDFHYYQFGAYVQDAWSVRPNLKLTFALRLDHNSNLSCDNNCFARLTTPFNSLLHDSTVPYNSIIKTGGGNAVLAEDGVVWEPRFGFAWTPGTTKRTVIRGGAGIFGDSIPLTFLVPIGVNSPNLFSVRAANLALTPGVSGGLFAAASSANQAFQSQFSNGATLATLKAAVPGFSTPRFTNADNPLHLPRYYEWNIEAQRDLGWNTVLSANYVGHHGIKEIVRNFGLNAYCDLASCGGFAGLPTSAPDPRFGRITEYQNSGFSNYDGLTLGLRKNYAHGFLLNLNYSYGHALDVISNGGRLPFVATTNVSETAATNPYNVVGSMYGNSDYDVRHNFTANFVYEDFIHRMARRGPKTLVSGWTISGTFFHRTGLPFTAIDTGTTASLANFGAANVSDLFAQITGSAPHSCGKSAVDTPCFSDTAFSSPTGFSNQGRNQFFGPNFTNMDLNVTKDFRFRERITFRIGATAYNLFNHPNFDQPNNDIASGLVSQGGNFGQITSTVGTPTSIFGAFVGSQNAPRALQFKTEVKF